MSKTDKKILDKIRKLLAKAKDPASSENEIEIFMKKAQELMLIHDVQESSVEIHVSDINKDVFVSDLFKHFKFKYTDFEWELLDTIARFYQCKVFAGSKWNEESRKIIKHSKLTVIGTEQNRTIVIETYNVLVHKFLSFVESRYKEYKIQVKEDHKNKMIQLGLKPEGIGIKSLERIGVMSTKPVFAGSYLSGCIRGLASALREQKESTMKLIDNQKHGLMVLKMNELISLAVPALMGKVRTVNNVGKKGRIDGKAFQEGFADGKSSNTNKLIG